MTASPARSRHRPGLRAVFIGGWFVCIAAFAGWVVGICRAGRRRAQVPSRWWLAVTVLTVVATASACGNGDTKRQPDAAINPATPVPVPSVTATGTNATLAVNRIVAGLRTHGLGSQMSDVRVYTSDTDPAHQLGHPGAYVARASFTDDTLPEPDPSGTTFARGGTVEVFTSADAARTAAGHVGDPLPGEHDLLSGAVLLRLSPQAPDTLVEKYRTALNETTGTPPQQIG